MSKHNRYGLIPAFIVAIAGACVGSDKASANDAETPKAAPEKPETPDAPDAPPAPEAPAPPVSTDPIPCGETTCTPPQECIHVVGSLPGSGRDECWVPCGENDACPDGMSCSMIHDGPGKVCTKPE